MQKGFATLEIILMVMVIGILASIAVPRFTSVTAAANTAKIQSDLSTIDTAIAVYEMEKGSKPPSISDLSTYFQGGVVPKPPTGKYFLKGEIQDSELTDSAEYVVGTVGGEQRAIIKDIDNAAEDFFVQKKGATATPQTDSTTEGGGDSASTTPGN